MNDLDIALIAYISQNDINKVIELINNGADVNYNNLPLFSSIDLGHYEITKVLLDYGANININNGILLNTACDRDNMEIVELLLKEGIAINKTDIVPIIYCVQNDNVDMLKLLIEYNYFTIDKNLVRKIWNVCIKTNNRKNILEYIVDNHINLIPKPIRLSSINKNTVKKYNFIGMLVNRNLIDIQD